MYVTIFFKQHNSEQRKNSVCPSCRTWCLYSLIVVWVDTHFILLRVEGVLAQLHRPQLVVGLQVGPAPQTAVDDVGQTFSVGNLKTAIQRSVNTRRGRSISLRHLVWLSSYPPLFFFSFCVGLYCFLLHVRVCVVTKMRGKCAWARPYTCQQKNIWNLQLKTENRIVTKKKNCWICFLIASGSDVIFLKGLCRYYHSEAGYGLIHLSLPLLWPFVYKNKFMNLKLNILIHCCHQVVIVWHRSFWLIVTVFLVLDDIQIMGIQSLPWQSWTTKIYFFFF